MRERIYFKPRKALDKHLVIEENQVLRKIRINFRLIGNQKNILTVTVNFILILFFFYPTI